MYRNNLINKYILLLLITLLIKTNTFGQYEFQVNDAIFGHQYSSEILRLADNNLFVTWRSYGDDHPGSDNSLTRIAAKIVDVDGNTILSEFQINDEIESYQSNAYTMQLNNGDILISWESSDHDHAGTDNDYTHIAAKVIDINGNTVVSEFQVNEYTYAKQNAPFIIKLENDNILFLWHTEINNSGGDGLISGKMFSQTLDLILPEFQINDEEESFKINPTATNLSNGNVLIVWTSSDINHSGSDDDSNHIAAKIINSNGETLYSEFQINDEIENAQVFPVSISLDDDKVLVCWTSFDESHSGSDNDVSYIAAKIINNDGETLLSEFQINDEIESFQQEPSLIRLDNTKILLSWTSYDENHSGSDNDVSYIAAKIINNNGETLLPEFQINDEIENTQQNNNMVLLNNNNIFMFWSSSDINHSGSDNSQSHVVGKIIDSSLLSIVENDITNFDVYPNPISSVFYIDMETEIIKIELYDVLGRLVLQESNPTNQIDVSNLASGLLFVHLETNEGIFTKKIIKE